ncbi:MAG: TIGR01459 family HAD-type hydrolase [Pseudolabrys sp.]
MTGAIPPVTDHFAVLAPDYDVVLSDVWGVVHNGLAAHPDACHALMQFRAKGGAVILITNSPRPSDVVARQLDSLHVQRQVYDGIVSSGDVTRGVIRARPGQSIFHLGPERDLSIFAGLNVTFAPLESADYVVCSGLENDETGTPEDYRARLEFMTERQLFMVCGNPDVVVERGDRLIYCAGAIADLYAEMGGEVLYAGKPYRPIYDEALALAGNAGAPLNRVLAIGDSVRTDLKGAHDVGVDFLFVTSGIHAEELGARDNPDATALKKIFAGAGKAPKAIMRRLIW